MNFSAINEIILAIILGLVQGITEFLPISSTAHLRLVSGFLLNGKDIGLTGSNIIQFGTLIAILQYFRHDITEYFLRIRGILASSSQRKEFVNNLKAWINPNQNAENSKFKTDIILGQLFIGTLPLIILGLFLHKIAENYREFRYIAAFLILGSILLSFAEYRFSQASQASKLKTTPFSPKESLIIGLFQTLAALPGISRSGATLSGSLIQKHSRAKAVRFAFLMSIPSLILLSLYDLLKLIGDIKSNGVSLLPNAANWQNQEINLSLTSLFLGFICAYVFGLIFLKWLLKYLSTNSSKWFIVYRIVLAILIIFFITQ